ncbi:hypothetical protein ACQUJV_24230 [Ralstonia pseudosolanacearum]
MTTLQQWMVVLLALTAIAISGALYVRHLKERCFALVRSWACMQQVRLDPDATKLHLFDYPLSASCVGISNDGARTKYKLTLGTHWRGILLRRAQLRETEEI